MTRFLIALLLQLAILPSWFSVVQAQARQAPSRTSTTRSSNSSVIFEPPRRGAPRHTVGGASRGRCPEDVANAAPSRLQGNGNVSRITALVPTNNYGLTVSSHPTFFAYLPQTSAREAFFSIKDEEGNSHYQKTFPISQTPGVVRFRLPETAPALKAGKNYKWSLVLMCGGRLRPDSPMVESWIQRIEPSPNLIGQLNGATPLQRAALYGKEGIWFDTLVTLADDSTLSATWADLLKSVGLGAIAMTPPTN